MEASKSADGADAITVGFQTVNFPATCSVNGNTNAVTAAAGLPLRPVPPCCPTSIVAALLAIAGVASLALRKKSR